MKNRKIFKIAFLSISVFIIFTTYFWYLYFHEAEGEIVKANVRLELINSGRVNYIDAVPEDNESDIPTYYFRVKNNVDTSINYEIIITDVNAYDANDGCTDALMFKRDELEYELKLDNKVIRSGLLSDIKSNILDDNKINGVGVNDYSLRIWLAKDTKTSFDRHYHYIINLREIK